MEQRKKKTLESYNVNTKELAEKFKRFMELSKPELERFTELVNGKKILDLGCGAGDHAIYLSERGFDVTCIDLSKEMIKICIEKGLKKTYIMDIEKLNFKEDSFDGVWAVTSLLHIPKSKVPKVIKSLYKLIKDEGVLYVCLKEGEGEQIIEDKYGKNTVRFFSFWKKEELIRELAAYFAPIESKTELTGHTVYIKIFFKKKTTGLNKSLAINNNVPLQKNF